MRTLLILVVCSLLSAFALGGEVSSLQISVTSDTNLGNKPVSWAITAKRRGPVVLNGAPQLFPAEYAHAMIHGLVKDASVFDSKTKKWVPVTAKGELKLSFTENDEKRILKLHRDTTGIRWQVSTDDKNYSPFFPFCFEVRPGTAMCSLESLFFEGMKVEGVKDVEVTAVQITFS